MVNPEHKSVARQSPGAYLSPLSGQGAEEHSLLSERVVRHAKRHDVVRQGDSVPDNEQQQIFAEQEIFVNFGEGDARERHEAQWERREPLQRHQCVMCECDERVAIAASARDPVETILQSHTARVTQSVFCTHVEHIQRVSSYASNQHTRLHEWHTAIYHCFTINIYCTSSHSLALQRSDTS